MGRKREAFQSQRLAKYEFFLDIRICIVLAGRDFSCGQVLSCADIYVMKNDIPASAIDSLGMKGNPRYLPMIVEIRVHLLY